MSTSHSSHLRELDEFVATIERLHREQTVSFVAAGDERIFAYGGNGFVAILSQDGFDGLVELETPTGVIRIEPAGGEALDVRAVGDADPRPVADRLAEATRGIETYYRRRYWKV